MFLRQKTLYNKEIGAVEIQASDAGMEETVWGEYMDFSLIPEVTRFSGVYTSYSILCFTSSELSISGRRSDRLKRADLGGC